VFIIFLARLSKNTRQGSLFPGASVHPRNESDREQPQEAGGLGYAQALLQIEKKNRAASWEKVNKLKKVLDAYLAVPIKDA